MHQLHRNVRSRKRMQAGSLCWLCTAGLLGAACASSVSADDSEACSGTPTDSGTTFVIQNNTGIDDNEVFVNLYPSGVRTASQCSLASITRQPTFNNGTNIKCYDAPMPTFILEDWSSAPDAGRIYFSLKSELSLKVPPYPDPNNPPNVAYQFIEGSVTSDDPALSNFDATFIDFASFPISLELYSGSTSTLTPLDGKLGHPNAYAGNTGPAITTPTMMGKMQQSLKSNLSNRTYNALRKEDPSNTYVIRFVNPMKLNDSNYPNHWYTTMITDLCSSNTSFKVKSYKPSSTDAPPNGQLNPIDYVGYAWPSGVHIPDNTHPPLCWSDDDPRGFAKECGYDFQGKFSNDILQSVSTDEALIKKKMGWPSKGQISGVHLHGQATSNANSACMSNMDALIPSEHTPLDQRGVILGNNDVHNDMNITSIGINLSSTTGETLSEVTLQISLNGGLQYTYATDHICPPNEEFGSPITFDATPQTYSYTLSSITGDPKLYTITIPNGKLKLDAGQSGVISLYLLHFSAHTSDGVPVPLNWTQAVFPLEPNMAPGLIYQHFARLDSSSTPPVYDVACNQEDFTALTIEGGPVDQTPPTLDIFIRQDELVTGILSQNPNYAIYWAEDPTHKVYVANDGLSYDFTGTAVGDLLVALDYGWAKGSKTLHEIKTQNQHLPIHIPDGMDETKPINQLSTGEYIAAVARQTTPQIQYLLMGSSIGAVNTQTDEDNNGEYNPFSVVGPQSGSNSYFCPLPERFNDYIKGPIINWNTTGDSGGSPPVVSLPEEGFVLITLGKPLPLTACTADINYDGLVDGGDLGAMLAAWGECSGCPEDLTSDGQVDGGDLGQLLAAFGTCE